ncbi:MAG: hypothetical protein RL033_3752 [Pseudomonadota bacterium]|jgi:hypothetical protein
MALDPAIVTNEPPSSQSPVAPRHSTGRTRAALGLFLLLVVGYYWFFFSAGRLSSWPDWGHFYDTQAEGFRAGHLYTTELPHPRLLRLPNPYDYANNSLWTWDYSLYDRRLYLYWGLTPAAALALIKSALRLTAPVGDSVITFSFLCLRLLAGSLLIRALAQRFAPVPPRWALWLALLVFAVAHPTPFLLARPAIYEAALTGGASFVVCAYYFAFRWLGGAPAAQLRWLAAASASLGLAGTTRPSLLPAAALFTLLLFARSAIELLPRVWRQLRGHSPAAAAGAEGAPGRALLRAGAAAFLPFSALTLLHLLVNQLRFGSWKEFGVSYQLGIPFNIGPSYLLANAWNYSFHPWHISCRFPFLMPRWHETVPPQFHLPSWLAIPEGYYGYEPLTGLVNALPFCWLLLAFPLAAIWTRWRGPSWSLSAEQRSYWRWFGAILLAVTLVSSVPILMLFAFSMRYEAEFASGIILLSCLAGWRWLSLPRSRVGRGLVNIAYGGVALLSVALAAPFGFTGYYDLFRNNNPALFTRLQETLSTCPASAGGCPTMRGCGP